MPDDSRKILTIFVASPGELTAERQILRYVVEQINLTVARALGWHVDLLGWEDTLPGIGRPQSKINPDVDRCDLFVGILWQRWGSQTGVYSSGFEEEFERAKTRRMST